MPTVRRSVLCLVACTVAACSSGSGPGVPSAGLYQSGKRLRARVTDAGDGARRFDGWYDTQLKTPCTFRLATDGVRRCVPMASAWAGPQYLDGACTVPATDYVDPKAAAPFMATEASRSVPPPAGCGADLLAAGAYDEPLLDAWRIRPEQPGAGALFFRDGSGVCVQSPVSNGPVHSLEPVTAAQLVGATKTIEVRGPSMAVEILTADDGSKEIGTTFDTTLGRPCFPSWVYFVTNEYRCYAATAWPPQTGAPQGCGTGAVAACADEIALVGNVCGPSFYNLAAAPCGASSGTGFEFHELGAPFDPKGFPSLTSDFVGTGRLRLVISRPSDDDRALFVNPTYFAAQDRYTAGPFFDTERQLPCDAAMFEDGTIRCMTSDTRSDDTYSDPACTNPIAEPLDPPVSCATALPPTTPQFVYRSPGRLYTYGSLVARSEAYTRNNYAVPPTCNPVSYPGMYYDLIPADPGMFATLTTLTE